MNIHKSCRILSLPHLQRAGRCPEPCPGCCKPMKEKICIPKRTCFVGVQAPQPAARASAAETETEKNLRASKNPEETDQNLHVLFSSEREIR